MHTSQALGDKKIQLAKRFFNINLYVMLFLLVPLGAVLLGIVKYPLSLTINEAERE
jgi:MATE family multidrug resistance protein